MEERLFGNNYNVKPTCGELMKSVPVVPVLVIHVTKICLRFVDIVTNTVYDSTIETALLLYLLPVGDEVRMVTFTAFFQMLF